MKSFRPLHSDDPVWEEPIQDKPKAWEIIFLIIFVAGGNILGGRLVGGGHSQIDAYFANKNKTVNESKYNINPADSLKTDMLQHQR